MNSESERRLSMEELEKLNQRDLSMAAQTEKPVTVLESNWVSLIALSRRMADIQTGVLEKAGYPDNGAAAAFGTPVPDGADAGAGEGVYRSVEQDFGECEGGAPELWETGWESERAACLGLELSDDGVPFTDIGDETGDEGLYHTPDGSLGSGAGLADDLIKLAYATERMSDPGAPVQDATTKKHYPKKQKKVPGQKQDDHSGYDFEMKM